MMGLPAQSTASLGSAPTMMGLSAQSAASLGTDPTMMGLPAESPPVFAEPQLGSVSPASVSAVSPQLITPGAFAPPRASRRWVIPAAILGVLVLAGGSWAVLRSGESQSGPATNGRGSVAAVPAPASTPKPPPEPSPTKPPPEPSVTKKKDKNERRSRWGRFKRPF